MILKNRRDTVKLLILAELLANPECNQREIAKKLNLTPQAISEHFKEIVNEELVRVVHKGYYEVTEKGEEWMTKNLLDLHLFSEDLLKKIYSKTLVAIAVGKISKGDNVKYWMSDGFVFAEKSSSPNGVALTSAEDEEEVLIKPFGSFTAPEKGEVIIVKVPNVAAGGSRKVDLKKLKELFLEKSVSLVVAIGIEALVACRKVKLEPIFFGAKEVCVEAAHHGSSVIVVCEESRINDLLRRLLEEELKFEIKDFTLT